MKIGNYFLMILASVGFLACNDSVGDNYEYKKILFNKKFKYKKI